MQVRFQGFSFQPGKKTSKEDFLKFLCECSDGDFNFNGRDRIFHCLVDGHDNYYTGVIITIKDHKSIPTLKDNKKIIVNETGEGESLMEFNYFVIHKTSYRGMYQHYHQSCSINQFGLFLKERFNGLRDQNIKTATKKEGLSDDKALEKTKKLKKDYGEFMLSVSIRRESLEKLMMELERISAFDYDIHTIDANERSFTPAPDFAKRVHKHVVYDKKSALKAVTNGIVNFIKTKDIKTGRIKGYDPEGVETIIKISENPDFYGEYEFDTVARNIQNTDIDDLKGNWIINELIKKAEDNAFGVVAK